ncbi:MAG: hypothetical protein IKQ17_13325 [Kiritimatiellae bacterium]|nr:hypothetical protein [Kiritimatiellia bacterium]
MKNRILPAVVATLLAGSSVAANTTVSTSSALALALGSAADGDTITLASGTYSVQNQIDVTANNVTLRAENANDKPVLDAASACRIMKVTGSGFAARGIVFKGGMTAGGKGGAVKVEGQGATATLKFVNCDFESCQAVYGGAIDAVNESYDSFAARGEYGLVSGCTFKGCVATKSDMWCGGGAINGALWIEDSTFDGCRSNDGRQGHAAIAVSGCTTITNCVFVNHSSTLKGIVGTGRNASNNTYQNGKARLVDCLVANSTFAGSSDAFFDSKVLLDRCVISNTVSTVANSIPRLYNSPSSNASESKVTSCLFVDNQCPFRMDAMPPLVNCTFVRNVGGLACDYVESLKFAVTNCVFWANVAKADWPFGATYKGVPGFYWHPNTSLKDLIAIGNTVIEGGTDKEAVAAVLAADLSGRSTALTAAAAADPRGAGFKDAANGDWTPRRSSVLVDAGVRLDGMEFTLDLAGRPRCRKMGHSDPNARPDIGCYEFYAVDGFAIRLR